MRAATSTSSAHRAVPETGGPGAHVPLVALAGRCFDREGAELRGHVGRAGRALVESEVMQQGHGALIARAAAALGASVALHLAVFALGTALLFLGPFLGADSEYLP